MTTSGPADGYVMDTSYADTFFRELSPVWLNYVAALNGATPRGLDRPFTYLELGCGFGRSTVVNAGAFAKGEFHACDVNPSHIEEGARYAEALGVGNITFHDVSFEQLRSRALPAFDFIVLHGVYSWVGADVRRTIRRLIHDSLKPGGLVYVSYNCLPGWSVEVPLRRLLLELGATADGGSAEPTVRALASLQSLSASKLRYFGANPSAVTAVEAYTRGSSHYLAHEFLNEAWEPFYSVDVADDMVEAGVRYLGSATLVDNHPALVVEALAAQAVSSLATPRQRQLAIDFAANQRFRRDVFVRGQDALGAADVTRNLYAVPIGCLGDPEAIGPAVRVPRGEIRFQDDFIRDLRPWLERGSITIGDAVSALDPRGSQAAEIARNLIFLVAAGALMPFAKSYTPRSPALGGRLSNPTVERALAQVTDQGGRRAIPSDVLGNGVEIEPDEAKAVREWLTAGGGGAKGGAARPEGLLRRWMRLGMII